MIGSCCPSLARWCLLTPPPQHKVVRPLQGTEAGIREGCQGPQRSEQVNLCLAHGPGHCPCARKAAGRLPQPPTSAAGILTVAAVDADAHSELGSRFRVKGWAAAAPRHRCRCLAATRGHAACPPTGPPSPADPPAAPALPTATPQSSSYIQRHQGHTNPWSTPAPAPRLTSCAGRWARQRG